MVASVSYELISRKEPFVLESGVVYLFLEKGVVHRRESNGKTERDPDLKQKTWVSSSGGKLSKHLTESKEPPRAFIKEFDSYEPPQNMTKYLEDVYYTQSSQLSTVLYFYLSQLRPSIQQKIR